MIRTAIALFAITLFVSWYVHVVNRTGNGTFRAARFSSDVAFSATVTGAVFVLLVTWALVGVYLRHVRGLPVGMFRVLGPPFVVWTACCVVAFAIGVVLAEGYYLADEQAFKRETRRHHARATRDTESQEVPVYSRGRWWPAGGQQLVSSKELSPEEAIQRARDFVVKAHAAEDVDLESSAVEASEAVWRVTFQRRELAPPKVLTVDVNRRTASTRFPRDE
ncbi:MAG: hypothetical protein JWL95_3130 [Gemmatimonadetes bacterium]|nr:hypothetical protein [Gemmatimonadota bacterium]